MMIYAYLCVLYVYHKNNKKEEEEEKKTGLILIHKDMELIIMIFQKKN